MHSPCAFFLGSASYCIKEHFSWVLVYSILELNFLFTCVCLINEKRFLEKYKFYCSVADLEFRVLLFFQN